MNPYLLTIGFLMLMGILTSSEVVRFSHQQMENNCFKNTHKSKENVQYLTALSLLEDSKADKDTDPSKSTDETKPPKPKSENKKPRKSVPLAFNLDRPPNNSRLNFYLLLHEDKLTQGYPKDFSIYETAARLIRILYKESSLYRNGCEYEILDTLLEQSQKAEEFTSPDDLSSLQFEDEKLQEIFYLMLKGHGGCQPLLNHITFDSNLSQQGQDKKINFMFASNELIYAVFPEHPELVKKLLELRQEFWEKIIDHEEHRLERPKKTRTDFKTAFEKEFEMLLEQVQLNATAYEKVFDTTLGKYGDVLLVYDPLTGMTTREKIHKSSRKKA